MEDSLSIASLSRILRESNIFQSLKMHELDVLAKYMRTQKVLKGGPIIRQGDPALSLYLIASGRVSVWIKKGFRTSKVAELFPGQYFGEMALISQEPRNASVQAEEDTSLFVLNRIHFEEVLMKNPAIAQEFRQVFSQRKQMNRAVALK